MEVGFLGVLAGIFITLKLTGHISWPWWIVLLPIPAGYFIKFMAFFFLELSGHNDRERLRRAARDVGRK
jgi:hypothetical protein